MKIHQIRNATCVIEAGGHYILIDPMLSQKGRLPSFTYFKYKSRKNPIVELPETAEKILDKVDLCLVTHSQKWGIEALTHTDHLDSSGKVFLRTRNIPVACLKNDIPYMIKNNIQIAGELIYWQSVQVMDFQVTAVPAQHGHTWTHKLMANGAGYFLEIDNEPTVYISGDTVLTSDVMRALKQFQPNVAIVAAGSAGLDVGGPILMPLDEIIQFIESAPGKVVANHMEALNHCPTTRPVLKQVLKEKGLLKKTLIPEDGESLEF